MGCGKSTIGKMLSRELGCQFLDMDRQLVARHNMSINEIFAHYGESYFRKSERSFLEEIVTDEIPCEVVATGGGVACVQENMNLMLTAGVVVYLKRTKEELLRRLIAGQRSRPLIQGKSPEEIDKFVEKVLSEREPHYERANIIVDCDYVGDASVVDIIKMALNYEYQKRDEK